MFIEVVIILQTAIIIAKLSSFGKVQLPENDLNYFLTWLKSGLSSAVRYFPFHSIDHTSFKKIDIPFRCKAIPCYNYYESEEMLVFHRLAILTVFQQQTLLFV